MNKASRRRMSYATITLSAIVITISMVFTITTLNNIRSMEEAADRKAELLLDLMSSSDNSDMYHALAARSNAAAEVVYDADGNSVTDLQYYLASPERTARYEALALKASKLIVVALNNGTFDEFNSDDSITLANKDHPYAPGNAPVAFVEWFESGFTDDRRVTNFGISHKDNPEGTLVRLFEPTDYEPGWKSQGSFNGEVFTNSNAYHLGMYGGWGYPVFNDKSTPSTLVQFQQFDDTILAQLNANMASWFGPDWQSK